MEKNLEKLEKKLKKAIEKSDVALIKKYGIETEESDFDEEFGACFVFSYQIDDRIERMDKEVKEKMMKIMAKDKCHVSLDRADAYPDGTAFYKMNVEQELTE